MNILVISATEFEIEPFLSENIVTDVLITGVGSHATTFQVTKKLMQNNYDLVIQAGIAGSFNNKFDKANVVVVEKETFGDFGIYEKGNFKTMFETGLVDKNDFPFKNGWLVNEHDNFLQAGLPRANGITVNTITDDPQKIKELQEKFDPDIESMEGAAFHYICLLMKVGFLQLRSISNFVGERDKGKWNIKDSVTNLNIELKNLIRNLI